MPDLALTDTSLSKAAGRLAELRASQEETPAITSDAGATLPDQEDAAEQDDARLEGDREGSGDDAAAEGQEGEAGEEIEPETSLDAPATMTAEEKADFAKLPVEAQKFLARRDKSVEQSFHARSTELADQRKTVEAIRSSLDSERQQLAAVLQSLSESPPHSEEDLRSLRESDPAEWAARRAENDDWKRHLDTIKAENEAKHREDFQSRATEARKRLGEIIPEWADPKAMTEGVGKTAGYLREQGYDDQAINGLIDPLAWSLARKAMLYDELMAKGGAVEKKLRDAPRISGGGGSRRGQDKSAASVDAARQKLKETGKLGDAVAAISAMRQAGARRR